LPNQICFLVFGVMSILWSEKYGKFNVTHRMYNEPFRGVSYLLLNKVSNHLFVNWKNETSLKRANKLLIQKINK
jgi:hypothetical protein